MEQAEWVKEATAVLAASQLSNLTFERISVPAETEDIGGGKGISITIKQADGQRVGAITRFEASPQSTVLWCAEPIPFTLAHQLREAAALIARATKTAVYEQKNEVLH